MKISRKLGLLAATALVASLSLGNAASAAAIAYMTGVDNPWGNTTNNTAMNTAFGAGNWDLFQGFTMNAFTGRSFVFIDGSDSNANAFSSFLAANQAAIEAFVAGGGHVLLNAAPNEGGSFSMGFGVTLNYPASSGTAVVTAAGVTAGLTAGGIGNSYTGSSFSHASVSGPLTALIIGTNGTILGSMTYGSGLAVFGGQTTTNFHFPQVGAAQLRVNELLYAANGAVVPNAIPEPATAMLLGAGLLGLAGLRRRRRA